MSVVLLVGTMLAAAALHVPVAYAMFAGGFVYLLATGQDVGLVAEQVMNTLFAHSVLIAVPMFMFAANVMNAGEISDRLFALCHALVGRMRGGLAQVDVLVSVLFSSMSGSAIADAAGPGIVTIRMMAKAGYPAAFGAAIVAASATLGPIIPPSISMVLYALVAKASVGALFLGGIVPGLLMAAAMMATVALVARRRRFPVERGVPWRELPRVARHALLPMLMPVILLGGIYSGAFTPTEAAAVAAAYALLLSAGVYRAIGWRALVGVLVETSRQTAVITLLITGAFAINYGIAAERLDQALAASIGGLELSPLGFMLVVTIVFLTLGCVLENATMLLVLVPVLMPSVAALGIDTVYFGVTIIVNITIGLILPPHGLLLFVLASLTGIPLGQIFREVLPFILCLVCVLFALVLVPDLVLALPRFFGHGG